MPTAYLVNIEGRVEWHYMRDPQSELYVGICPALNLTAQGEDWPELMEVIDDIMQDLFSDLAASGQLPAFLSRHGWRLTSQLPMTAEPLHFDVPLHLLRTSPSQFAQARL